MSVAGVILAAGGSSRMGRAKQLLPYPRQSNETMIERAARTMLASCCRPVVIVIGFQGALVQRKLSGMDVRCVENPRWSNGMGSSISTGIRYVQDRVPRARAAIIMACDQPRVPAETLDALVRRHAADDHPLAVACGYGAGLGVPALFDQRLFQELLEIDPRHGAKALLARHAAAIVASDQARFDIDTPEDYASI